MTRSTHIAVLVLVLALARAGAQELPNADVRQVPIYLEIEPAGMTAPVKLVNPGSPVKTVRGVPLRIRGVAALELRGKELAITVTPPQRRATSADPKPEASCPEDPSEGGKAVGTLGPNTPAPPTTPRVTVGDTGTFEAQFTPRTLGEHEVVAIDASGRFRGQAQFESVDPDFPERCGEVPLKEVEQEAAKLIRNACRTVELLRARADELPASPAKDELRRKLGEIERELREVVACGDAPDWVSAADNVREVHRLSVATRTATAPLVRDYGAWLVAARRANGAAASVMAELMRGNVLCDQLDVIVNGLKFCSFYLDLLAKPGEFLVDWAKENLPPRLVALVPSAERTPAVKEGIESAWKGVVTFKPKLKAGKPALGVEGLKRALGVQKMAFELSTYAASRVFDVYCEQFHGPVTGAMTAEFYSDGVLWWQYRIEVRGELRLRYPKKAGGEAVALTGELMGNATKLKSWDKAIPVLFPKLAQGTVFKEIRLEPFDLSDVSGLDPLYGAIIDKGGAIARNLLTPAFFRVPLRGELRGDAIRLEVLPATVDFDDARVKVYQIMLPVLSLWPTVNEYALPYKGARFLVFRAMDDGPIRLPVARTGSSMAIERSFHREKSSGGAAKGVYDLALKACNPACP